jgi:hypothetical protein
MASGSAPAGAECAGGRDMATGAFTMATGALAAVSSVDTGAALWPPAL